MLVFSMNMSGGWGEITRHDSNSSLRNTRKEHMHITGSTMLSKFIIDTQFYGQQTKKKEKAKKERIPAHVTSHPEI